MDGGAPCADRGFSLFGFFLSGFHFCAEHRPRGTHMKAFGFLKLGQVPGLAPFRGFLLSPIGGLLESQYELANFEQRGQLNVSRAAVPTTQKAGKADSECGDHIVCQGVRDAVRGIGGDFLVQFRDVFAHVRGAVEEFAMEEPFLKAALTPDAEVLGGDGRAVEALADDLEDFGQVVEPGEDFGGFLAVVEADVELLADGAGEAGDFAAAVGEGGFGLGRWDLDGCHRIYDVALAHWWRMSHTLMGFASATYPNLRNLTTDFTDFTDSEFFRTARSVVKNRA